MEDPQRRLLMALSRARSLLRFNQQGNIYHDAKGHFTGPGGIGHAAAKVQQGRQARRKRLVESIRKEHKGERKETRKRHTGERKDLLKDQKGAWKDLLKEHRSERKELAKDQHRERRELTAGHAKAHRKLAREHDKDRQDEAGDPKEDRDKAEAERQQDRANLSDEHKHERHELRGEHARARDDLKTEHAEARESLKADHREERQGLKQTHQEEVGEAREAYDEALADQGFKRKEKFAKKEYVEPRPEDEARARARELAAPAPGQEFSQFASGEDADEWGFLSYHDAWRKASGPELKSIGLYQDLGFARINSRLRDPDQHDDDAAELDGHIERMDSMLARYPTPDPVTAYRVMDLSDAGIDIATVKPGDTFHDPGYVSTSIDPNWTWRGQTPNLKIRVPPGTPSIYASGERELLLGRGQRFRVAEVDRNAGQIVLEAARPARA